MKWFEQVAKGLEHIDAAGLRRHLKVVESPWGRRVRVNDRE